MPDWPHARLRSATVGRYADEMGPGYDLFWDDAADEDDDAWGLAL